MLSRSKHQTLDGNKRKNILRVVQAGLFDIPSYAGADQGLAGDVFCGGLCTHNENRPHQEDDEKQGMVKPARLFSAPQYPDRVLRAHWICRHEGHSLASSLSNEQAIERVPVMVGQFGHSQRVSVRDKQSLEAQ
jgi:hypothetical protein